MKLSLLFLFILFLPVFSFAYTVDLNAVDLNYSGTSSFVAIVDCDRGLPSEFLEGDLVDYSLWHCNSSIDCFEVLSGNFVFEPDCSFEKEFSIEANDNNVGLFFMNKKRQERDWWLQSQKFFYKKPMPLFSDVAPPFLFPTIPEISFFWLFYLGIVVIIFAIVLLELRNKLWFPALIIGFVLISAGILMT